jgi:hypothetical protein
MVWLLVLIIGFSLTRLYHLTVMPPFLDELIYVRWLNEIRFHNNWLIPLEEFGWEPLGIWLAAAVNRLVTDPLLSLRLASVIASGACLLLINQLAGKAAALFYWLSPLVLLHDRLGLRGDNLVVLAALMVFYGLSRRRPLWWGLGAAIGLLTKTTAAALPAVIMVSYLLFRPKLKATDFLAAALALAPVGFYWLTGSLAAVIGKQATFVGGWLVKNNWLQIGPWLYHYLTWPVALLAAVGFILAIKDKLLLVNWFVPLVLLAVSAKILFPRYLLPFYPFILIYGAIGFNWLRRTLPRMLRPLAAVFLIVPLWFDWQILTNLPAAPLAEIDQWQYVTGWPSGYGIKELKEYLQANQLQPLTVYSGEAILTDKVSAGGYAVTNINHEGITGELIREFPRPGSKSSLKLWRLP